MERKGSKYLLCGTPDEGQRKCAVYNCPRVCHLNKRYAGMQDAKYVKIKLFSGYKHEGRVAEIDHLNVKLHVCEGVVASFGFEAIEELKIIKKDEIIYAD